MQKNNIGRPCVPENERFIKISISLPAAIFELLKGIENRSAFIVQAIAQKLGKNKIK